jgi:hypothetical protein
MRRRCADPNFKDYKYYGGAGIVVCERWNVFANFLEDMGERPSGKTIERLDMKGPYCKENCKWANHLQQMNNTSRNRVITHNGKTMTVAQWARYLDVPRARLSARLNALKLPLDKALSMPKYARCK